MTTQVTPIPLPADNSAKVFANAQKESVLLQRSQRVELTSPNNSTIFNFEGTAARFHNKKNTAPKVVSEDEISAVDVPVAKVYKVMKFNDQDWATIGGRATINAATNTFGGYIAQAIDCSILPGSDSPYEAIEGNALPINNTVASIVAVAEVIEANGSHPDTLVLNYSFKSVIRAALMENVIGSNALTVDITDGMMIAGMAVYFRDLGSDVGYAYDSRKLAVGVWGGITTTTFLPQGALAQQLDNAVSVYVETAVGIAIADQGAFQLVELGDPETPVTPGD